MKRPAQETKERALTHIPWVKETVVFDRLSPCRWSYCLNGPLRTLAPLSAGVRPLGSRHGSLNTRPSLKPCAKSQRASCRRSFQCRGLGAGGRHGRTVIRSSASENAAGSVRCARSGKLWRARNLSNSETRVAPPSNAAMQAAMCWRRLVIAELPCLPGRPIQHHPALSQLAAASRH